MFSTFFEVLRWLVKLSARRKMYKSNNLLKLGKKILENKLSKNPGRISHSPIKKKKKKSVMAIKRSIWFLSSQSQYFTNYCKNISHILIIIHSKYKCYFSWGCHYILLIRISAGSGVFVFRE